MVHKPVDHGRGDHGVAEDLTPAPEGLVRSDDDAGPLIAGRGQLEEEVGRFPVEGDVADLVVLAEPLDDSLASGSPTVLATVAAGAVVHRADPG